MENTVIQLKRDDTEYDVTTYLDKPVTTATKLADGELMVFTHTEETPSESIGNVNRVLVGPSVVGQPLASANTLAVKYSDYANKALSLSQSDVGGEDTPIYLDKDGKFQVTDRKACSYIEAGDGITLVWNESTKKYIVNSTGVQSINYEPGYYYTTAGKWVISTINGQELTGLVRGAWQASGSPIKTYDTYTIGGNRQLVYLDGDEIKAGVSNVVYGSSSGQIGDTNKLTYVNTSGQVVAGACFYTRTSAPGSSLGTTGDFCFVYTA